MGGPFPAIACALLPRRAPGAVGPRVAPGAVVRGAPVLHGQRHVVDASPRLAARAYELFLYGLNVLRLHGPGIELQGRVEEPALLGAARRKDPCKRPCAYLCSGLQAEGRL